MRIQLPTVVKLYFKTKIPLPFSFYKCKMLIIAHFDHPKTYILFKKSSNHLTSSLKSNNIFL